MLRRERGVKRLRAQSLRVAGPAFGTHQGHGPEATNVAVVQGATVVELKAKRGVATLALGKIARVDQQGTGEARLYDDSVAAVEVEHYQLRSTPSASDPHAGGAARQLVGGHLAEHVALVHVRAD